jgi:hypothetical protein
VKDYNHNVLKIGDQVTWDPEQLKGMPEGGLKDVPSWVLDCPGVVVGKGTCRGDFQIEFKQGDEVRRISFAQNWFLEPLRKTMLASERAGKAAEEASKWHQGSGTHADGCSAVAQHFEGLGHKEIAELWADAAEAEAAHLKKVGGEWFEYKDWLKTESGKATDKATKATKLVDPKFELNEWM